MRNRQIAILGLFVLPVLLTLLFHFVSITIAVAASPNEILSRSNIGGSKQISRCSYNRPQAFKEDLDVPDKEAFFGEESANLITELNWESGNTPVSISLPTVPYEAVSDLSEVGVLWDNGPLVTCSGCGWNGADVSEMQSALEMITYGFANQDTVGRRLADDFTVSNPNGWNIATISFFQYMIGSSTDSTITGVNLQIWDGEPGSGGSVIWGNQSSNLMIDNGWAEIYRAKDNDHSSSSRPIMFATVDLGYLHLPPGNYWLDWQASGIDSSSSAGPFVPPISILGQTETGNALKSRDNGATWEPAVDNGLLEPQGLPFIITDEYQRLVERYAPYIRYHYEDIYRPINATAPLGYARLVNYDEDLDYWSPTLSNLMDPVWDHENTYIDLLGNGSQEIRNVYINTIRPQVDLQIYARVVQNAAPENTVLQYWFYYYDNSWTNHHEGDWEMVQIVLDHNEDPLYAAYSQHHGGSKRWWNDVEKFRDHPIVYVARGSHANYFKSYEYFYGATDQTSPAIPGANTAIQLFPQDQNSWTHFLGHWGDRGQLLNPLDQDGPRSPGKQGTKWNNPIEWSDGRPWDEAAIHNRVIKLSVWAPAPLDVHVYESASGAHVGWGDGQIDLEIDDAEYFDNPATAKRTIILHKVASLNQLYEIVIRYRPSVIENLPQVHTEPQTVALNFPDLEAGKSIRATYSLTNTLSVSTTGTITVSNGSNFVLMLDIDGDGVVDQQIAPTTLEESGIDLFPPATITDLSVIEAVAGNVTLSWTAPGDDDNIGTAISYDIRYLSSPITEASWVDAMQVISPPPPSAPGTMELFIASGIPSGTLYFAIETIDDAYLYSELSNSVVVQVPYHRSYLPVVVLP